jgi:hypothetical protein
MAQSGIPQMKPQDFNMRTRSEAMVGAEKTDEALL